MTRSPRLPSLAVAFLAHAAIVAAAIGIAATPKAMPELAQAIKVKLAPVVETPAPEMAPPPVPTPQPKAPPRKAEPTPAAPETPAPVLTSTAEATASSRSVAAPEPSPPPPPAPDNAALNARKADYYAVLLGWLDRHKVYPREARSRRDQGTVQLYFRMSRDGRVLSYRIDGSSGSPLLDQAALSMIETASPLPPFPAEMKEAEMELVVPVEFFLQRGKRRG